VSNGSATRARVERFLLARIPFVSVRTAEPGRVHEMLRDIAGERQLTVLLHTLSRGLRDLVSGTDVVPDDRSLYGALEFSGQQFQARQNLTVVFTDVQNLGDDNDMSRRFADLAALAEQHGGCILVITADPIWPRLQGLGMSIALDVPDIDEMQRDIRQFLEGYRGQIDNAWDDEDYAKAASILSGATKIQALNILSEMVVKRSMGKSDLAELSRAKDSIFSDLSGIERIQLGDKDYEVGGLAGLRAWLQKKRPLLTMDLRDRGMRPPRGILLIGVPGCGKSLSAKAIAVDWELPLYRLDMASIFGQYVGQSENRLKEALTVADTVSPCVLWIDEIEKGLAGSGSDSTGVTTRLVGQFLYWLQESEARVFVVATANDVRALPQELLRSGRFDDMFFVDLPEPDERRDIICIYLRKYFRGSVSPELLEELVALSEGFAGSDLQAAVAEIGHEAVRIGDHQVTEDYLRSAFANIVPLSRSAPERIDEVRQLGDRAIPASGRPARRVAGAQPATRRVVLS
jgi:ATP-dependent 26S proteasome regulatory subunit